MSIYSGFATRQQQETYDNYLEAVVQVLQKRLIKFYKGQQTSEEKFLAILAKLYYQMKNMEKQKYLFPKSSRSFEQLVEYLKEKKNQVDGLKKMDIQNCEDFSSSKEYMPVTIPVEKTKNFEQSSKQNDKSVQNSEDINQIEGKKNIARPFTSSSNSRIKAKSINLRRFDGNFQDGGTIDYQKIQIPLPIIQSDSRNQTKPLQHKLNSSSITVELTNKDNQSQNAFRIAKFVSYKAQSKKQKSNPKQQEISQQKTKKNTKNQSISAQKQIPKTKSKQKLKKKCKTKYQIKETHNKEQMRQLNKINKQVSNMLKGYVNRLRKSGNRSRNNSRSEISQLLKFME